MKDNKVMIETLEVLYDTKYNCNDARPLAFSTGMAIIEAIIIKLGMLVTSRRIAQLETNTRPHISMCFCI